MNDLLSRSLEMARGQPSREADTESGRQNADSDMGMEGFFKQVNKIEGEIESIGPYLQKLQAANLESHSVTKASAMKAIKQQMERDVDEVGKIALKLKMAIEEMDKDNMANRKKPGCCKGSGVDRSRTAMTVALKKKLKDRVTEFQDLRVNIHNEYRQVVERRIYTVTGTRPDEDTIDQLIETGNSEQIYEKAVQCHGRAQIMDTLAEIQERCDTVREIEKKLYDLQQMFMDLSVLVDAQGDLLDNIETQVSNAVDHVNSAQVVLQKGKKSLRSKKKYMCFAIILLVIIIIVIFPAILRSVKNV
ncbi:syntaxin-132-like [Aristolochia californica]|uniref:syntaxin-132-like n=1 Tax=Aristolochia californica TaxID=171875 RepID=UPI0035E340CC